MAELAVVVKDKVHPDDFYRNCQLFKRGDVIDIFPDGWQWGTGDLSNPDWRIIKMPGVDPSSLSALLVPELNTDPKNPSKTLQQRAFKLDLDDPSVPLTLKNNIADDSRAARTIDLSQAQLQQFDLLNLKKAKAPISDPAIIGASSTDHVF